MRRPHGNGLVENELRILAVALGFHREKRKWNIGELLEGLDRLEKGRRPINEATAYRIVTRFCQDQELLSYSWRLPDNYEGRPCRQFALNSAGLKEAKASLAATFAATGAPWAKVSR